MNQIQRRAKNGKLGRTVLKRDKLREETKIHLPDLPCEIQRIASVSEAVAMTFDYRTVARGENFV